MSPFFKPNGRTNKPKGGDARHPLKRFPVWLVLGLVLAGCGGEATTTVNPQSSYTTTAPYTDSYYTNPGTATNGNWTQTPYVDTTLPVIGETPVATTSPTPAATGVEIKLVSKDLPGVLSWERCEAQIAVKNHEATAQQGYLLARFTLKGKEVEMQYRVLSLSANGSQTFVMKSTVRADDVSLEYRTKLL